MVPRSFNHIPLKAFIKKNTGLKAGFPVRQLDTKATFFYTSLQYLDRLTNQEVVDFDLKLGSDRGPVTQPWLRQKNPCFFLLPEIC